MKKVIFTEEQIKSILKQELGVDKFKFTNVIPVSVTWVKKNILGMGNSEPVISEEVFGGKKIIVTESQLNKIFELINDFVIYHDTYSSAIREALEYVEKRGFKTDGDDIWNKISVGPKKPSEGKTNKFSLDLYKDGKIQKKLVHIQVYNMGSKYELNVYIN